MSDTVIKVENLSKSYLIRHQSGERYTALRDVLTNGVKSVASSVLRGARVPLGRGLRVGNAPPPPATRHSPPATEEFWALNDVSFEVKQGERVGIIGRNGAGKSTLLKILSRITEPTKGRVHIKGRVASLLEVGTGFHPELTGRENIYLNGAILGMTREEIRRKFEEIVAFAEVEKFLDTPVKRYSSGMYVRLAFAVAAHLEPEILVVDEVLAVGDLQFQQKCLGKMEAVADEGRTILFVSHNISQMASLCSRAIWLHNGKINRQGLATQIASDYRNYDTIDDNVAHSPVRYRKDNERLLQSFVIVDEDGQPRLAFEAGEYMNLLVKTSDKLPELAYFEWLLITDRGHTATSAGTFMYREPLGLPTHSRLIQSHIGPLLLAQGNYWLTLRIGVYPGYILDEWERIAGVVVSKYIPDSLSFGFDTRRGIVYLPTSFRDGVEFQNLFEDKTNSERL